MSKKLQHARVLALHHRVEVPNSFVSRFVDQPTGQVYPHPVALPTVLDKGRVFGLLAIRFAVVAHERDDLVRIVRIQCYESEVIYAVDVGEKPGLLFGKLLQRAEEAQIDGLLAKASVEALKGGNVVGLNKAKRDIDPAGQAKSSVFIGAQYSVLSTSQREAIPGTAAVYTAFTRLVCRLSLRGLHHVRNSDAPSGTRAFYLGEVHP